MKRKIFTKKKKKRLITKGIRTSVILSQNNPTLRPIVLLKLLKVIHDPTSYR